MLARRSLAVASAIGTVAVTFALALVALCAIVAGSRR
jgi:hypothetical protein